MRLSEFHHAVEDEFGVRGAALVDDLSLVALENRTSREALKDGVPAREVWLALCSEMDVPPTRRHGVGRLDPRGR